MFQTRDKSVFKKDLSIVRNKRPDSFVDAAHRRERRH